jgi:hypothetical protein
LRRIAFVLSQKNIVKSLDFVTFDEKELKLSDPFEKLNVELKTFIVKVSLTEEHTGLLFTKAVEKYGNIEPLMVVIDDNNVNELVGDFDKLTFGKSNISDYI